MRRMGRVPSLTQPVIVDGRLRALRQPVLHADALLIRPWQQGDVLAVLKSYQDPAIQQCMSDRWMT